MQRAASVYTTYTGIFWLPHMHMTGGIRVCDTLSGTTWLGKYIYILTYIYTHQPAHTHSSHREPGAALGTLPMYLDSIVSISETRADELFHS